MRTHFPTRKRTLRDATLLWKDWRCALIKQDAPRLQVTVSHGQETAKIHWKRGADGTRNIQLEGMWRDFERSVDNFIAYLRADEDRRAVVLYRFREHRRLITAFQSLGASGVAIVFSIPPARSVTASGPDSS